MTAKTKKKLDGKIVRYGRQEYEVIRESGKYFFCKGAQFRKENPFIEVTQRKVEQKEEEL